MKHFLSTLPKTTAKLPYTKSEALEIVVWSPVLFAFGAVAVRIIFGEAW